MADGLVLKRAWRADRAKNLNGCVIFCSASGLVFSRKRFSATTVKKNANHRNFFVRERVQREERMIQGSQARAADHERR